MSTYLIRGARILDGEPTDVLIRDGVVAKIGGGESTEVSTGSTTEVVDGVGMVVLPGLVDLHTHLREPGREDAETIASGAAAGPAAVLGVGE